MRNVIIAAVLFAAVIVSTAVGSVTLCRQLDTMLDLADEIPQEKAQMEAASVTVQKKAETLWDTWDKLFPYLTYVTGYTALNRADDAVLELYTAVRAESWDDVMTARMKLIDALKRMRELERVTFSSVF